MIFPVNFDNTESESVNELKNYLIVQFFFENFQMKNGLKIDVNWFDFVDEVFAVFLRYVDKAMWERPANPGFLVGRKIFFVVVFLLF